MAWNLPLVGTLRAMLRGRRTRYNDALHARLTVRELERRRVLSASYTLGATGLSMASFSPDSTGLGIGQSDGVYQFTLSEGTWSRSGGVAGGITGEGTARIDVPLADVQSLPGGIDVDATENTPSGIDVTFESADFSTLVGPLSIGASGDITDAPGSQIYISQDAAFAAAGQIMLADSVEDSFTVGGNATFVTLTDGDVSVGVGGASALLDSGATVRLGSVSFNAGFGQVRIQEDSDANPAPGNEFTMTVARRDFDADKLDDANQGGFVKLGANGGGIQLDSLLARDLLVEAAGPIVDYRNNTQIIVDDGLGGGDAWFQAEGPITLADQSENHLRVVGRATFVTLSDESIDVGASPATNDLTDSGGNVRMGTLSFNAGFGQVRIVEDGDPEASDQFTMTVARRDFDRNGNEEPNQGGDVKLRTTGGGVQLDSILARELRVESAGAIVDYRSDVAIVVDDGLGGGNAWFQARSTITLAQDAADTLRVNQLATFIAGDPVGTLQNINVGPPGNVNFGQLNLTGQAVTVQEDSSTELTGVLAHQLLLDSTGNITDVPSAPITIRQFASLGAGIDIVLGDADADFRFPNLQLFDANQYLAIEARHASLQLNTQVNVLTEPGGSPDRSVVTRGTLYLTAAGSIAQIGGGAIQANEAAFVSQGAIVLTGIDLGDSADSRLSNHFAASATGALNLATIVPSEVIPVLLPRTSADPLAPVEVQFVPTAGGGLVPVLGKRTTGDDYALVVTGVGNVTVGRVSDPTMAQAALDGITVVEGNAYLAAKVANGIGDGENDRVVEAGDIFFTARGAASTQIVNSGNQVFTAVADGQLVIDGPSSGEDGVFTALVSATGVVTSVGPFNSFDGRFPDQATVPKIGPRMVLTPPSPGPLAPTTAEVAPPNFLQSVEISYGSTGEMHFIFEFVWADVKNPPDAPPLPDSVLGTIEQPEVIDVQAGAATQVFTHEFAAVFLATNPAIPNLPTPIRMFNDPLINLFASGGELDLNQVTTQLEEGPQVTGNFVSARSTISVPPPSVPPEPRPRAQPLEPALSPEFVPVGRSTRPTIFEPRFGEIRPLDFDQIERILYGPVHVVDGKVEWENARGGWPREWLGERTGDWIEQIRREIARGAWDVGQRFQIRSQTDRGEQIVEGWEFKPPGVEIDATSIDQEEETSQRPTQPPEQASDVAPTHGVEHEVESPDTSPRAPQPQLQSISLGMALALVRLGQKRAGEGASPSAVADSMERLSHRGFSAAERRRRLAQRLRNLTKS